MKILFVVNWYTPATEKVLSAGVFHYEQCMALQKYCDIRLYWPLDESVKGLYQKTENGLFIYRSGGDSVTKKYKWLFESQKYMINICREFQPDIIHANVAYPAGLLSVHVGRKLDIPVIVTEHAPIEQMALNNPIRKYMREFVYRNSYYNVCVSDDSKDRLQKYFPKVKFVINYNAVINPNTIEKDNVEYRTPGVVNCAIVAVFYDKYIKGYQFLLPAIRKIKEQGYEIHLHICGGGQYQAYYEQMAKDLGIDGNCTFYGQCNRAKVYSIVSQMDFCISSSIFECSGVSVQEEMLLGKPLLVTKSGGANSLTTKETAIVVDRNSTDALVEGLIKMIHTYQTFSSSKIEDYAFNKFEIGNVTARYKRMYDKIMEKKKK